MIVKSLQDFFKIFINKNQPIIAIDYGLKKTGVAISTPDYSMAIPFKIIKVESVKKKIAEIINILQEKNACAIVIGLPITMNGEYSNQTDIVENFANELSKRTNLPIFFQDERLTSKAADNFLKSMGINRKKRNSSDDLTAASMILETTLNSIKNL